MSALPVPSAQAPRAPPLARVGRVSPWAWGTIAITTVFVGISWWWLSRDLSVPSGDPGSHLLVAATYRDMLAHGSFEALLRSSETYPPLTYVVGGLAALIGGLSVAAPIVGQNLVYVPLLVLGCYQTGRLVRDERTGFLAATFGLGTPLIIEQFHVFMLDAPQTALVAVAVWLILASRRFSRVGIALAAGVAVGAGMATKETFPLYIAALLAIVLVRERGWHNWRGIVAFAAAALVVGAPWYIVNFAQLEGTVGEGWSGANHIGAIAVLPEAKPPLVSLANLAWYGWAVVNGLLFAPLTAFVVIGVVRAVRALRRRRDELSGLAPELLGGLAGAWLALTVMPHHDLRYAMPLTVFFAVLGTAWIAQLGHRSRLLATTLLGCAVVATTLGVSFGVGHEVRIPLTAHTPVFNRRQGLPPRAEVTLYADSALRASGPRTDDDVLAFFEALRREGIAGIVWRADQSPFDDPVFDLQGAYLFSRLSLEAVPVDVAAPGPDPADPSAHDVVLIRMSPSSARRPSSTPPCMRLSDGTGFWVQMVGDHSFFCPSPHSG